MVGEKKLVKKIPELNVIFFHCHNCIVLLIKEDILLSIFL